MTIAPQVLLIDAAPSRTAALLARLHRHNFATITRRPADVAPTVALQNPGAQHPDPAAAPRTDMAVLLSEPGAASNTVNSLAAALAQLVRDNTATIVWGGGAELRHAAGPLVEWLAPDVGVDEVVGKLGTLSRYVPLIRGMERELQQLHRLGTQLNRYFGEIDQEMRLAGRLQRDFLPRGLPQVGPYSFAALYRPASWVSGDMYDVQRIDEDHLGLFIADAMGHGVAAGLLTMFLRQALQPKRVSGSSYTIVPPAEVLGELHTCLVRQNLPNSQFVTAVYAVLDTRTGELRLARAGHPYPVLAHRPQVCEQRLREVRSAGGLLGLADVPLEFEETAVQLVPGDKLILYTDGAEDVLVRPEAEGADLTEFTANFQGWAALGPAQFVQSLSAHLDNRDGSLFPADDITLVVLERDASGFEPERQQGEVASASRFAPGGALSASR